MAHGHGIGLGGIVVIGGLLYFTGAGTWMWDRIKSFDENCYMAVAETGAGSGGGFCSAFGTVVDATGKAWTYVSENMSGVGAVASRFGDWVGGLWGGENFASLTMRLRDSMTNGTSALSSWVSPSEKLQSMMQRGPQSISIGAGGAGERVRAAMDSFVIGQHYLSGNNIGAALPWLQQGAKQPGYGIMSQLALGDMYQQGAGGMQSDPVRARYYYMQAQQSLGTLSSSNTPQAQQMLSSLPASPQQISQQLTAAIGSLNKKIGK